MNNTVDRVTINQTVNYERTCDLCHLYVELDQPFHTIPVYPQLQTMAGGGGNGLGLPVAWYSEEANDGENMVLVLANHLCHKCHFAARLEGKL